MLKPGTIEVAGQTFERDEFTNISPSVLAKLGRRLHAQPNHPLRIIKVCRSIFSPPLPPRPRLTSHTLPHQKRIEDYFNDSFRTNRGPIFAIFDNISPVVTVEQNFDSLLTPADHPSRSKSDNYYVCSFSIHSFLPTLRV